MFNVLFYEASHKKWFFQVLLLLLLLLPLLLLLLKGSQRPEKGKQGLLGSF